MPKQENRMGADVFFIDMTATSRENLPAKLTRLVTTAGLDDALDKNDLTAVKVHFGERGNTAYIRPVLIRKIIRAIRKAGATPF